MGEGSPGALSAPNVNTNGICGFVAGEWLPTVTTTNTVAPKGVDVTVRLRRYSSTETPMGSPPGVLARTWTVALLLVFCSVVTVTEARPLASATALVVLRVASPVMLRLTIPPGTGLLLTSRTSNTSGWANAWPAGAYWPPPEISTAEG